MTRPDPSAAEPRAVLVTGASSGIGEATVLELHRRGYRVYAGVRRDDDGQRLVCETSQRVVPVLMDITDESAVASAASLIDQHQGDSGLYGLVNNAGFSLACPLEAVPLNEFRRQFEVNLFGQLAVTKAMLPLLRRVPGRILNVTSLSGVVAGPYVGPYTSSKHAFEALSHSLRLELRHSGIKVTVIEPADIKTPIWSRSTELADQISEQVLEETERLMPEQEREKFRADIAAVRASAARFERDAIPVDRVAKAIAGALDARRPKIRYRVGIKTLGGILLRNLPGPLRDRIVLASLGMKP